jgi:hypothetical protein
MTGVRLDGGVEIGFGLSMMYRLLIRLVQVNRQINYVNVFQFFANLDSLYIAIMQNTGAIQGA